MSYPDKKGERTDKRLPKSKGIIDSELGSLRKLLSLLNVPISQTQVATGNPSKSQKSLSKSLHLHQRTNESRNKATKQPANEITELENFSVIYQNQRGFSSHPQHKIFLDIFTCLVRNRFTCREWFAQAPPENILRVLICLRLLMREPLYQKVFHELHGVGCLAQYMESVSSTYLKGEEQTFAMELLVNMAYIFQKLSAVEDQRAWVVEYGAHKTLVNLLSTRDSSVLLGALLALISLSEGPEQKEKLGELPIVENLLTILQDYDLLSKRMGAELLRLLCPDQRVREQVRALEGVPVLLSLLHSDHLKLLWSVTWVLVQLCADREAGTEIRVWGGVQQLLHLLHVERVYVSDRSSVETLSSANAASRIQRQHVSAEMSPQETLENTLSLQAACCAALTELVLDDATAYHVVQENGVYIIGKLILPRNSQPGPKEKSLQCYAFRTLRFLFSLERNRHLFKRVFSTELFEMFIDVGHYVRDITAYEGLQMKLCLLPEDELSSLKDNIEAVNLQKSPIKVINGYAILDHLGSGAFGSVFKVRKPNRQNTLALKEVNLHNPVFGKDKRDRDSSAEKIVSEITIIKEQMSHPNIVRYYKTFLENDHLYIVMEQIEGVPLADHINSTREKQQQFTEERVWNIFIQMCRALRYLHKDKRIVHRDLTPNNVMLGERDKVTITDFGLAKQKHENSKLTSVVGTILYSCPEIVKNEPYGEKADVWAAGCILYQTVTLRPPFNSTNMLSLVTKIVEAVYEPVGEGVYSERVSDVIKWCLTPDADLRPDIVEVGARISDLMMKLMDGLCVTQQVLERRLEGDRARAQKYFLETNRTQKSVSVQQRACIKDHGLACRGSRAPPSETVCSTCLPHTSSLRKLESSQDRRSPQQLPKASGKDSEDELDSTSNCDSSTSSPRNDLPLRSVKHSTSVTEEQCPACGDCAVPKAKPRPASAGICVSQRKVREIDDPIQKLLILLHKIIYISQLPPALYSFKRRAIERFKKSLFDYRSSPSNLKMELTKLLQGSPELVEQMSVSADWRSFRGKAVSAEDQAVSDNMSLQEGITYEHMSTIIEDILEEQGYYNKT